MHGMVCVRQETFLKAYLLDKDNPQISSNIQGIWHHLLGLRANIAGNTNGTGNRSETRAAGFVDTCTPLPKRSWNFTHTGGGYSHNGAVDYPRFPFSELHLGKFQGLMEFQSWKVNFKTEVCSKTADPQLTMQWIKEVEIAKSIDELMTSRSIVGRRDFTDYDMLDAMIASTSKKLFDKHTHFRKRASVEEQRAQKHDR